MKIAALILAAGTSSRMGTPKQLLPYKHTTLLGWAIENAVKSKADTVYCVLGANVNEIKPSILEYNIEIIHNKSYEKGLSSSIVAGVKHIQRFNYDGILIMLCDQPSVNDLYLNSLISKFKSNPNSIIASCYETLKGVPAVFPSKQFSRLLNLKDDKGAKLLLNSSNNSVFAIDSSINLFDIDTPEDYDKIFKNKG